jgi:hypothetical protein
LKGTIATVGSEDVEDEAEVIAETCISSTYFFGGLGFTGLCGSAEWHTSV